MAEEIEEGIKFAMSRGETLQQAMQSFYNAGYPKEEVEEAARALQRQLNIESEKGIHAVHPDFPIPKTDQKISSYESQTQSENPRKKMIILLSVLLVVLLFILAGIFFFREQILQIFTKLLG